VVARRRQRLRRAEWSIKDVLIHSAEAVAVAEAVADAGAVADTEAAADAETSAGTVHRCQVWVVS
jgi:hypothetical protein